MSFAQDNVYGLFPFFIPEVTKQNLTKLGIADKYKYNRPIATPVPKVLNTLTGIRYVFNDFNRFKVIYKADMEMLTEGYGFMLTFDEQKKHDTDKAMVWHALLPDLNVYKQNVEWFKNKTKEMLKEKSVKYDGVSGTYVDIIRDVINLVSVHWASDKLVSRIFYPVYLLGCLSYLFSLSTVRYPTQDKEESAWFVHGAGGVDHTYRLVHVCVRELPT